MKRFDFIRAALGGAITAKLAAQVIITPGESTWTPPGVPATRWYRAQVPWSASKFESISREWAEKWAENEYIAHFADHWAFEYMEVDELHRLAKVYAPLYVTEFYQ